MKNILITGVGSGLGFALAKKYLELGERVYAIGRHLPSPLEKHPECFFLPYDLQDTSALQTEVSSFLHDQSFDLAILNAGILGKVKTLKKTPLKEIKEVIEINVWANKELIDTLDEFSTVRQIIGISSGAAVNGSKGWGAYSLSKSSLNMLMNVYAKELPHIHFTALAPGVIKTPMVEHILDEVDRSVYPSAQRLADGPILTPGQAADKLISTFDKLLAYESGSFIDVRSMP
ncbi:MAG: SDR family NAD(P)-dependent oxidoreductase [Campylobacterota bacterium]|nr:SDR family NAD(P)-dependent oxidoreductase [Campylobacterota bacterium]